MDFRKTTDVMKSLARAIGRRRYRPRRRVAQTTVSEISYTETLETRALLAFDFGDAPDSTAAAAKGDYQTRVVSNGPRHQLSGSQTTLFLGAGVDANTGATQSSTANLDDQFAVGGRDDEDGVLSAMDLTGTVGADPRVTLSATNRTGKTAILYGWIDFNHNGVFENATERAHLSVPAATSGGRFTLEFATAPAGSDGTTYARFRLSTDTAAGNSIGAAADGEVEDYPFVIQNRLKEPVEVIRSVRIGNEINGGPALSETEFFGSSTTAIGDVDGNGVIDLASAIFTLDGNNQTQGTVVILLMSPDGTAKKSVRISSELNGGPALELGNSFGSSIAALGDINGDGVVDIAVGDPGDDTGGPNRGAVYIVRLNADGTARDTTRIASEYNAGPILANDDYFGSAITSVGDFDLDGVLDLAVGAQGSDADGTDRGKVYILLLNANGTVKNTTAIQTPSAVNSNANDYRYVGSKLISPGDLDGDGIVDLAATVTDSHARSVIQILHLNSDGTVKGSPVTVDSASITGSPTSGTVYDLTAVGDLDGDQVPDMMIVGNTWDTAGRQIKQLSFANLNPDGTVKRLVPINGNTFAVPGLSSDWVIAASTSWLGDINGDGSVALALGVTYYGTDGYRSSSVYIVSLLNALQNSATPSVPTIITPGLTTTQQRPTLSWLAMEDAITYDIWLRNRSTGATLLNSVRVSTNSYTPPMDLGNGRFEYSVRAKNEVGKSAWTPITSFTIDSPVVVDSVPDSMQTRPTFSWQPLPGAVAYDLWVSDVKVPLVPLLNLRTNSAQTTHVTKTSLPDGKFRLYIRSVAFDGTLGKWSIPEDFSVVTQTKIILISNQFLLQPTVHWTAVPGVASYEIYISSIRAGMVPIQTRVSADETRYEPDHELPVGKYRAWVRPVAADGSLGPWCAASEFSAGDVLSPLPDVFVKWSSFGIRFNLPQIAGAKSAMVSIDFPAAENHSSARTVVQNYTLPARASFYPLNQGQYHVTVRYISYDGRTSSWTPKVSRTVRITPDFDVRNYQETTDILQVNLTYTGAQRYEIQLQDTAGTVVSTFTTSDTDVPFKVKDPVPLGVYDVRVRGLSADGTTSDWSKRVSYTSIPKQTLTRIASSSNTTPNFEWNRIAGAISYDVVLRDVGNKRIQYIARGIEATSYTSPRLAIGKYELWVIANGSSRIRGEWASLEFEVELPAPPPRPVIVFLAPPWYDTSATQIPINWIGVAGADHYFLLIADSQDVVVFREHLTSEAWHDTNQYVVSTITARGSYRVWVRAIYGDGTASRWSDPEWFFIESIAGS